MAKVYRSALIHAHADRVWTLVRNFNGLPQWHPAIGTSEIEGGRPGDSVGCVRRFTLRADGRVLREQLLALSDHERTLTYNILASPMPVANYVASMRITPITMGNMAFAEWWAEFDVTSGTEQEMIKHIGDDVFVAGLDALDRQLSRP
jgi:hypothetical protein